MVTRGPVGVYLVMRLIVAACLLLLGCDTRTNHIDQTPVYLWETVPGGEGFVLEDLIYEQDYAWPILPLVNGAWCGSDIMYWDYGLESSLDKSAVILKQINNVWHLWYYSKSYSFHNEPIGSEDIEWNADFTGFHCIINPKIHRLKIPKDVPSSAYMIEYQEREYHYDAICEYHDTQQRSILVPRGFQGRMKLLWTTTINQLIADRERRVERRIKGLPDDEPDRLHGATDILGKCPFIMAPINFEDADNRERAYQWVNSPPGRDAPLGETVESIKQREYQERMEADRKAAIEEKERIEACRHTSTL